MDTDHRHNTDADADGLEFLRTEVATGLTFSKIALETKDESKIVRNRANARKAYDAVLHFAPGTSLSAEEAQQIDASMALLKSALQQLGEDLDSPISLGLQNPAEPFRSTHFDEGA